MASFKTIAKDHKRAKGMDALTVAVEASSAGKDPKQAADRHQRLVNATDCLGELDLAEYAATTINGAETR